MASGKFFQKESPAASLNIVHLFSKDPVSKNAIIILATLGMAAAAGFIFTVIAAKIYTIESLGIATLLFSYANIIVLITRFGTEQSMIRFFREKEKSAIFSSSFFITAVSAIVLCIFLIVFSYAGITGTNYPGVYSSVFLVGVTVLSISQVCGVFFLAMGRPVWYFLQNVITSSRFIILFFFISFGALGIFGSLAVASGLSAIFAILVLLYSGVKFQVPDKKYLADSLHFAVGNYLSDCLFNVPIFLIPVLVFSLLGRNATAIYSVSYAFASIAFIIPISLGYGLFMSGCQDRITVSGRKITIGASLAILTGIILIFFFWGTDIVSILGPDYAGTSELIIIIMSSSIFALFFQIYSAQFKVHKQVKKLFFLNCVFFIALMSLSYVFITTMGLAGAGYAWVAAYSICLIPIIYYSLTGKNSAPG